MLWDFLLTYLLNCFSDKVHYAAAFTFLSPSFFSWKEKKNSGKIMLLKTVHTLQTGFGETELEPAWKPSSTPCRMSGKKQNQWSYPVAKLINHNNDQFTRYPKGCSSGTCILGVTSTNQIVLKVCLLGNLWMVLETWPTTYRLGRLGHGI